MEKIVEKYTMDDVFGVIEKHIGYHERALDELRIFAKFCPVMFNLGDIIEDVNDHSCAIAALKMLESELKGEVEY